LQFMPLTLEEITEREEGLRQEIAEREHLLAAYQLIRADRTKPASLAPQPALGPAATIHRLEDRAQPSVVPRPRWINPALAALCMRFGGTGKVVEWAIEQMTEDYTLNAIDALLKREGLSIPGAKISVVLTRLKARGKIEEISRGRGRRAAVFRKPESAIPQVIETSGATSDSESITQSLTRE
jgi:hypothetical protein